MQVFNTAVASGLAMATVVVLMDYLYRLQGVAKRELIDDNGCLAKIAVSLTNQASSI